MRKDLRIAALPIALLSIIVGIVGIASPDIGMTIRRWYFARPGLSYAIIAVRSAMGLGLILAASSSRWPRTLRALGAVVCLQGLSATLLGLDRARAVMEWEGMQGSALLRAGAAVALASGCFIVFAVKQRPRQSVHFMKEELKNEIAADDGVLFAGFGWAQTDAPNDPIKPLVGKLDLERYNITIKNWCGWANPF